MNKTERILLYKCMLQVLLRADSMAVTIRLAMPPTSFYTDLNKIKKDASELIKITWLHLELLPPQT